MVERQHRSTAGCLPRSTVECPLRNMGVYRHRSMAASRPLNTGASRHHNMAAYRFPNTVGCRRLLAVECLLLRQTHTEAISLLGLSF